jgi:hypothetical protein
MKGFGGLWVGEREKILLSDFGMFLDDVYDLMK